MISDRPGWTTSSIWTRSSPTSREIAHASAPRPFTSERQVAPRTAGIVAAPSSSAAAASRSRAPMVPLYRYDRPYPSTRSGSILTLILVSVGFRHGYSSFPRYFFASPSICASAPSVVSAARPLTDTQRYASSGSTTRSDTRASSRRYRSLARPTAVLNDNSSPSTSTQTTVECGEPSGRSVVTAPTYGCSRNRFCSFVSVATASLVPGAARISPRASRARSRSCGRPGAGSRPCGGPLATPLRQLDEFALELPDSGDEQPSRRVQLAPRLQGARVLLGRL